MVLILPNFSCKKVTKYTVSSVVLPIQYRTYRTFCIFDEWGTRHENRKRTINLHYGDMTDSSSLIRIIQQVQPDEIYNLAAQSHVKVSFDVPEYTAEADAIGTLRMLEAVRILGLEKKNKDISGFHSELFGKVQEVPQKETGLRSIPVPPYRSGKANTASGSPRTTAKAMACLL